MKKLVLTLSLLAGATAVYAQGTINWTDYVPATKTTGGFGITVFETPTAASVNNLGNTVNDLPAGTASYGTDALAGAGAEVGLYVDTSAAAVAADVLSGSPLATAPFLTGASAGAWSFAASLVATSSALPTGSAVFVELAAWTGGASSYAVAHSTAGDLSGYSVVSSQLSLGGPGSPPATPPTLVGSGITDFTIGSVPEPSTIALGVMGASAFLMRLRRK